ncbi:MAG: shikimate kinase [Clostridia bacterium]|nr:shikimate kinase [Clostridia bacterium]
MKQHIYLVGLPGSGKTTLGKALAASLALPFADVDARIETLAGMPITQIFAEQGEEAFRRMESETLAQCAAESPQVIATGGGVVLRGANVALMRATGTVMWIDRPVDHIVGDVRQDTRPLLAGDAAERLRVLYAEREPLYRAAAHLRLENVGTEGQGLISALAFL